MKTLAAQTLERHARATFGLGTGDTPLDPALLACTLRRAAAFRCPCPARTLLEDSEHALEGLFPGEPALRDALEEVLESLIIFGDLVEGESEENSRRTRQLYGAPLSYVRHGSGIIFLLGIFVDGVPPFTEELKQLLHHRDHLRILAAPTGRGQEVVDELKACGYYETALAQWLRTPKIESAASWKQRYDVLLGRAATCGELTGLEILDPAGDRRYYRGRWVEPARRSGRFVGRRPQRWGADLWIYVEVKNGTPVRFVDLPALSNRWRGCDEAWHLQAALDAVQGRAQVLGIEPLPGTTDLRLRFYSPLPLWANRRLDCFGQRASMKGCLFAYQLSEAAAKEEIAFMTQAMWLASETAVGR